MTPSAPYRAIKPPHRFSDSPASSSDTKHTPMVVFMSPEWNGPAVTDDALDLKGEVHVIPAASSTVK